MCICPYTSFVCHTFPNTFFFLFFEVLPCNTLIKIQHRYHFSPSLTHYLLKCTEYKHSKTLTCPTKTPSFPMPIFAILPACIFPLSHQFSVMFALFYFITFYFIIILFYNLLNRGSLFFSQSFPSGILLSLLLTQKAHIHPQAIIFSDFNNFDCYAILVQATLCFSYFVLITQEKCVCY